MSWLDGLRARMRDLGRGAAEERLNEEIAFHLEMEARRNERGGLDAAEARRRARLAFGGAESVREEVRGGRPLSWLDDALRDARQAWRSLRREPAFAWSALLTIALGIGANTAIFGVVDALFLRAPAGVDDASSIVQLYIARDEGNVQTGTYGGAGSFLDYRAVRDNVQAFEETAASLYALEVDLDRGPEAQRIGAAVVTQSYLPMLGIEAERGRLFVAEEDSLDGTHPVAVVSYGFATDYFGSADDAIDGTLLLNGQRVTVIGVLERGFVGISTDPVDVWLPMAMAASLGVAPQQGWRDMPGMMIVNTLGRLAPGTDAEAAAAVAQSVLRGAAAEHPDFDQTPRVLTGTLVAAGSPSPSPAADLSIWLLAVTLLLLLIACANVANLLLTRHAARQRETATRVALGAQRSRLLRQHLTESFLLAFAGGVLGLLLAFLAGRLIVQFPVPPNAADMSARPILFALALALITALISGSAPALQTARADLGHSLKDRHGSGRRGRGLQRALIAVQGALAVVLLVGTGLFVRSLREVAAIDTGMQYEELLNVSVDLANAGFDAAQQEEFFGAARARVLELPSVVSASMVHFGPFVGMAYGAPVDLMGPDTMAVEPGPDMNWVGAGYFATVGSDMIGGREFEPSDRSGPRVAIVNESFERHMPDGRPALGACLVTGEAPGECTNIIGVVEDQRHTYMDDEVTPKVYFPRDRTPAPISWGGPNLVVRVNGPAGEHARAVREALQGLDARLPYVSVEPVSARIRDELLPYRLGAILFSLFGVLALTIAAVGIYGVLGHFVAERRPEIGIRRSLGADDSSIHRFVIREGMTPLAIGALFGLALAFAGSRLVASLLYGVGARDPMVFGGAAIFLLVAAVVACWIPARRAIRTAPMLALRSE